jgi:hypothetical protein
MKENRMSFARVRSPQNDEVGVLYLAIGAGAAAHSEDRRQTDDARSVSSAVAAINVVAAHHDASKFLRHEIHLVGCLRTAEQAEALPAIGGLRLAKAAGSTPEGFVPRGRAERTVFADKRRGESKTVVLHKQA